MKAMKKAIACGVLLAAVMLLGSCQVGLLRDPSEKIRVVVVTADNLVDRDAFLTLFDDYDDVEYAEVHGPAREALFGRISGWNYDVIVLHGMPPLSAAQEGNLETLVRAEGVGLVVLNPELTAFGVTSGYREIMAAYALARDGLTVDAGPRHVHVVDPNHPVTRLMSDFEMDDEIVAGLTPAPAVTVLLTSARPAPGTPVAWTGRYGRARVCVLQGGSAPETWANIYYRALVVRALRWTAGVLK